MSLGDGQNYVPEGSSDTVVSEGDFCFAAAYLDHGHIYGQCTGLLSAGATLTHVYDPDPARVAQFVETFPQAKPVENFASLLQDPSLQLIASAAIPCERSSVGRAVLEAGKDYFSDKSPFTSLDQLEDIRKVVAATGRRYFVYYSERVHNEAAWHAGELIKQGAIGEVIHVTNLAPHRLAAQTRPDWFFEKAKYGGIITDIGSHQVEQFLTYSGAETAQVAHANVMQHPDHAGLEHFGEFGLTTQHASFYSRVDWLTPSGLPVWGDGRTFIVGSRGTMELRKYTDVTVTDQASVILLCDEAGPQRIDCLGRVGFPFFGQLILDSLEGTERAMTQKHIFAAAELSMMAQSRAEAGV